MFTSNKDSSMPGKHFASLYAKLNLLTISIIILTVAVISGYVVREHLQNSRAHLQRDGVEMAKMVAAVSEYGIYTENVEALNEVARSLSKDEDHAYVNIYNKDRQVLLSRNFKPALNTQHSGIPEQDWDVEEYYLKDLPNSESSLPVIDKR